MRMNDGGRLNCNDLAKLRKLEVARLLYPAKRVSKMATQSRSGLREYHNIGIKSKRACQQSTAIDTNSCGGSLPSWLCIRRQGKKAENLVDLAIANPYIPKHWGNPIAILPKLVL